MPKKNNICWTLQSEVKFHVMDKVIILMVVEGNDACFWFYRVIIFARLSLQNTRVGQLRD